MSRFMGLVLAVVVLVAFSAQIQPAQAQCPDNQNQQECQATATPPQVIGDEDPSEKMFRYKVMIFVIALFGGAILARGFGGR